MAVVDPAKPKATIEETAGGLEVSIPARRNWFIILFLGFWLCGWAMGEVTVIAQLASGERDAGSSAFLLVWLACWTVGGGLALYILLWSLAGRERIRLGTSTLSIKREVFGMGRLREYELAHVRDLRTSPSNFNPYDFRSGLQFWGIAGGLIAFDHGAATVQFGASLEEGEAKSIIERLKTRAAL